MFMRQAAAELVDRCLTMLLVWRYFTVEKQINKTKPLSGGGSVAYNTNNLINHL